MSNDRDAHDDARTTRIVHAGRDPFQFEGFVNPPVYRGSTVLYPTVESLEGKSQRYTYGRRGTPTMSALEEVVAELEGGVRTVLVSSGLAAVASTLLALAKAGDHILVADSVYAPTRLVCDRTLTRFGVDVEYYDPLVGGDIAGLIRANTSLIYCETPGSQTFEMQDLPAIAGAARSTPNGGDIWIVTDNTWASPLYCNPFKLGADVSIQAGTKYIVGHADAMLGTVTGNARAEKALVAGIQEMGLCAGTEEIYLGLRGVRTLDVRLQRHWESGLKVARWLAERPEVDRVLHPALESDPGHAIWKRDFTGASGLFSAILKPTDKPSLCRFLESLRLFGMGFSWGGYESLIIPFDPSGYRTAVPWNEKGPAIRIHIGLEDPADLIADLEQGLAKLAKPV